MRCQERSSSGAVTVPHLWGVRCLLIVQPHTGFIDAALYFFFIAAPAKFRTEHADDDRDERSERQD